MAENYEKKLEKTYRRSALFSVLGVLIVLAALIYSSYKLYNLQKNAEVLKQEIRSMDNVMEAKRQQLDNLLGQIEQAKQQIDSSQYKSAKTVLEEAIKTVQASPKITRIYIHIREEAQRELSGRIKELLQANGYLVPGIERLVDLGPKNSELRYFRLEEGEEAQKIADLLRTIGVEVRLADLSARYATSKEIRPGHMELWLSPIELKKKVDIQE